MKILGGEAGYLQVYILASCLTFRMKNMRKKFVTNTSYFTCSLNIIFEKAAIKN